MLTLENSLLKQSMCLVTQSCLTLCDPMDCSPSGSSVYRDSPGKTTGVGCHALLQGISPTQGSNPGVPLCRCILYLLSHQETYFQRTHLTPNNCFKIYILICIYWIFNFHKMVISWYFLQDFLGENLTKWQ